MNRFEEFQEVLRQYFLPHGLDIQMISTLHDCSENNADGTSRCWYCGDELNVINMDLVAKDAYRMVKTGSASEHPVSTADSFVINHANEWYFIEFKDVTLNANKDKTKRSVLKKAYENWYMILDILYEMKDTYPMSQFDFSNPIAFAKNHVHYILVCNSEKNAEFYKQVRNHTLLGEHYTPVFMQRLKDYVFKDAYAYTENELEQEFVKNFVYEQAVG